MTDEIAKEDDGWEWSFVEIMVTARIGADPARRSDLARR